MYKHRSITRGDTWVEGSFYLFTDPTQTRTVGTYIPEYSELYELCTPSVKGPKSQWKPFQHYKRWLEFHQGEDKVVWSYNNWSDGVAAWLGCFPNAPYACWWDDVSLVFGDPGKCNIGLPDLVNEASSENLVVLPDRIEELKAVSVRAMSPSIKRELSILNSLYELKDFRSVPRLLDRVTKTARRMKDLVWKGMKPDQTRFKSVFRTVHDLALTADDVFLQKEFNVDPLISDIASIYSALSKLARRLQSLQSASGRLTTKHFTWRSDVEPKVEILEHDFMCRDWINWNSNFKRYWDSSPLDDTFSRVRTTRKVTTQPVEFRAHMQYTYQYNAFQAEHAQLFGLLDSLGVNFNPSIIWNAIPWSFVIDWVIGVSRFLDQHKVALLDPKVNILQYCWSIKTSRRIDVNDIVSTYGDLESSGDLVGMYSIKRPTIHETAYCRQVEMPSASSLTTSGLDSHEFTLGAALVFTKTKRLQRRRVPKWSPFIVHP